MIRSLSYGGGVNSTALALWLMDRGEDFLMVFADTGGEYPETLEYVDYFEEATGHSIDVVRAEIVDGQDFSEGGLYQYSLYRHMVPFRSFRWCTRIFKIEPIQAYHASNGIEEAYVGIDAGEAHRAKQHIGDVATKIFPLVENNIDRAGCTEIIRAHGLDLPRKSGCYICPYQRIKQWNYLFRTHPELWDKAVALEENAHSAAGKPITFFDNEKNLADLKKQFAQMDKQKLMFDDHLEEWEKPCGCYD